MRVSDPVIIDLVDHSLVMNPDGEQPIPDEGQISAAASDQAMHVPKQLALS
jgi:hypothetical protein